MVEISLSGSGEGLGWVTSRGYSTAALPNTKNQQCYSSAHVLPGLIGLVEP